MKRKINSIKRLILTIASSEVINTLLLIVAIILLFVDVGALIPKIFTIYVLIELTFVNVNLFNRKGNKND